MTGCWIVEETFIPHDTNLMSQLGSLLFKEEFDVLLGFQHDLRNKVTLTQGLVFPKLLAIAFGGYNKLG